MLTWLWGSLQSRDCGFGKPLESCKFKKEKLDVKKARALGQSSQGRPCSGCFPALEPDEVGKAGPGQLWLAEIRQEYEPHTVQVPQNGPPGVPNPRSPSAMLRAQAGPPWACPTGQDSPRDSAAS